MTADEALERLMAGNARYVADQSTPLNFSNDRAALVSGQNPYASILSCSDSRVSPEFCFDEQRGDLFVARVAGNYLTTDFVATLEYAAAVLYTPLIMVLGHESCGAVRLPSTPLIKITVSRAYSIHGKCVGARGQGG